MAKHNVSKCRREKLIKDLEKQFAREPLLDPSDPKVYGEVCRKYSEIVTLGSKAADRALLLSRATAHMRIYTGGD